MADQRPTAPGSPWRGRSVWSWIVACCALLVAASGSAGLVATLRVEAPPPSPRVLDRYDAGEPLAERLVIVFLPQLDEQGVASFDSTLRLEAPGKRGAATPFTIARPDFTPFEDVTVLLLAGNSPAPSGAVSSLPPTQPPDNLARSLRDQGREALLFGPAAWRGLFGVTDFLPGAQDTSPTLILADAGMSLRSARVELIVVYLADLSTQDLAGDTRNDVAAFGTALGERDALLIVGGGAAPTDPLYGSFSGPAIEPGRTRRLHLNDIASTCAVVLGARYPSETRGRIIWPLLVVDDRQKAVATLALARQRTTLAMRAQPFGVPNPPLLREAINRFTLVEVAIQQGQYAYAYQLASSSIDEAERVLVATATTAPILPPRRAAWPLVVAGVVAAFLAPILAALTRSPRPLVSALIGALVAAGSWFFLTSLLRPILVPTLATVAALVLVAALFGGILTVWLSRGTSRARDQSMARRTLAVELLVLLAALPIALCAYRYGLPWQLRWEETAPLFRWRSALLAPPFLLLVGYGWTLLLPLLRPLAPLGQRAGDAGQDAA